MAATAVAQPTKAAPPPSYDHLARLSDERGLFEHARGAIPRREHGYCVDDVARGLLVAIREPDQTTQLATLTETYLRFIEAAIGPAGAMHNRMDVHGTWTDTPGVGDWWGRSLWALGHAATRAPLAFTRKRALRAFLRISAERSPHPRAMTFAVLGAGQLMLAGNTDPRVRELLLDGLAMIPGRPAPGWDWPEERLRYGNGSLAEAVIVAGAALHDDDMLARGLHLLDILLAIETRDDRLSVTGVEGRGPGDSEPQFDQQPIEIVAIADAAARAFDLTADRHWLDAVRRAWAWFLGENDSHTVMVDENSGAGFDGLERTGRNDNRGAESTLAALGTYQQARRLRVSE